MRNVSGKRIIKIAFFCSLLIHCLFLGMPGFILSKPQPKKTKEIKVQIEIEKLPPLLPKIDIMGEEKKLKKITKKEPPKPEPELEPKPEPEPQPEEEKIVKESELKKQIEKTLVEKTKPEPLQEAVKVINPQDEAMLRYQDMIKQRIESCRRYPNWAKKQGFEGAVHLTFTVLSNGNTRDIKIARSSGFDILDDEAVSTVKKAAPFPPIPQDLNRSFLKIEVAVVFKLK